MNTKDKTRDKLMSSMRKTKAGASKDTPVTEPEEKSAPTQVAAKKKTTPVKKQAAKTTSQAQTDNYQSRGCTVWPD